MAVKGCLGIIYGVLITIYTVAVVFYLVRPVTSVLNDLSADVTTTIYVVFLYWCVAKVIPPTLAVLLSVFDGTNIPLSYLFLISLAIVFVGSLGFDVVLLNDYGRCNSPLAPYNPCNDLLYCCVYYADHPSCSGFGPCPAGYPASNGDLHPNADFAELGIYTTVLLAYELGLIGFAIAIGQSRKKKEAKFSEKIGSMYDGYKLKDVHVTLDYYKSQLEKEIYKLLPRGSVKRLD